LSVNKDDKSFPFAYAVEKLTSNQNSLNSLAGTTEAQAAENFARQNEAALKSAFERGDQQELSSILSSFLSTDAGAKIANQLKNIIK